MRADLLADLPRVRTAPLGWWFPMAFIIHGAAPGGVLFGLSLGGVIPEPWSYFGIALGIPLTIVGGGILVFFGLRARSRIERMREAERGYQAVATVVSAEQGLGNFRSRRGGEVFVGKKVTLTLNVSVSGGAPYSVTQECYFGVGELPALQPGRQLAVQVHPRDPELVFVPYQRPTQSPHQPQRGPSVQMWG
jgi:hypothetical protein